MLASVVITVFVIPSVLLLLVNVAATQGYRGRPPSGPDTMGLAALFFAGIAGTVGLLVATWVCAGHGGLQWISSNGGLAGFLGSLATLGVCLAAGAVLVGWTERCGSWLPPIGMLCGLVAPLALGGMLLACAWMPPASLAATLLPGVAGAVLGPIALGGLLVGAYGGIAAARAAAANYFREMEEDIARDREVERKQARSPLQAVQEDYAAMPDTSPLWTFVAALPDYADADCRALIVGRCLNLPDLDAQLAGTLSSPHPRYRHGCMDMIRFAPADRVKPQWAPAVEQAIVMTAQQIRENADWLKADHFSNPNPVEHLRAIVQAAKAVVQAAKAVGGGAAMEEAIRGLQMAIHALQSALDAEPESAERTQSVAALSGPLSPVSGGEA